MSRLADSANGWMALFRVVTPALLGVLIWIVTTGLGDIRTALKALQNDYYHELVSVKERLGRIEIRLRMLNGVSN